MAKGDTVLVHAAAGGVGLILCQWAKSLGAKVIGVVGSEAKAELARKYGCKNVLILGQDELVPAVKKLTKNVGVNVVYDSVGKDTFIESLDSVRPLGMMVTYGNASGPPPAFSPLELSKRGSLFLTRPNLVQLYLDARGLGQGGQGAVRGGGEQGVQGSHRADLSAGGCGGGASGPRGAPHDRRQRVDSRRTDLIVLPVCPAPACPRGWRSLLPPLLGLHGFGHVILIPGLQGA